ncbi:hypothetical protein SAMN05443247_00043 [Bradyrhizobium erythrophlei]|nr:hypothetical protein SAMN05443247_00043 [Bradyrhizobium erythrophlei]
MIEGLGFTEAGLRRIIAAHAPGHLTLRDWDDNLDAYAQYVARNGEVIRVKFAKAALKAVVPKQRPSLLRNVEKEIHSLLCTNSRRYAPIRSAFFLSGSGKHSQTVVISSIASVIASTFNVALGLATSLVAVCMLAALKVGVGAYCRYYAEKKVLPPAKKGRSGKGAKR